MNNTMQEFSLSDQNIIITGGGYGLGKAIAIGLADVGANVVLGGRTEDKLKITNQEIADRGGSSSYFVFDAVNRQDCKNLVDFAVDTYGDLNAMVANHGVIDVAAPEDITETAWNEVISINLTGCFNCAQAAGKAMIDQNQGGAIVLTSSNGSLVSFEGLTAYGASKGGVDQMCRQLAVEWGQYNIRVNTINPGYTTNPMGGKYEIRTPPEFEKEVNRLTPLSRRGKPEDFAGPVIFLCSEASKFITGHCLVVDGGYCAQ